MAKKKSSSLKRQLKYLKTEKGKAAKARNKAKPSNNYPYSNYLSLAN